MAIFKCKICGGALEIDSTQSVATCQYCGTKQTLPKLDDERKATLYDRANHFRRNNDFDKAMGIYEAILNEDSTDAEAYWSIVLCRYGIEYVEDPSSHKRVPTVNRVQFTSIFDDEDYKSALTNADGYQREIYESEANAINEIQKGFLAISHKEEPFDVFICYKETDNSGRRTQDSVLATELYNELTREGFKVFFSRITLEDKLGVAYEPYIFAALHSAKVMVVLGTRPEHFNAVWVKNEWSRFLALIKNGAKKTLIPAYRDMDPYDLPEEFSHLQAQDMSKLGFMQDLIRGIRKIVEFDEPKTKIIKETVITGASVAIEPLFKRADMALADGEFGSADAFYEQILNQDPENADAYVGKLLAEFQIKTKGSLKNCEVSFEHSKNYKKAIQFANEELKKELSSSLQTVLTHIDDKKKEDIYQKAKFLLNSARDIPTCKNAQKLFLSISGYLDAEQCVASCQEKINDFQKEWEQLRLEQQRKEEERKIAAKKTAKRILIISLSLLLVGIIAVASYFFVTGVAIPNSQYKDALEMIEEQKYDDAISLLQTAKENALFDKTISKIDRAIESAETVQSIIGKTNYEQAIYDLLSAGIMVDVVYQCDGGTLLDNYCAVENNKVSYSTKESFSNLFTAEKTGYQFVGWSAQKYEYQSSNQAVQIVLKADWSEIKYIIEYYLDGGMANNLTEYGIEHETFNLKAPEKAGYTFIGWTGTDIVEPTIEVIVLEGSYGNREYTANWKANMYTVTLDTVGGEVSDSTVQVVYGEKLELPTPTWEGHIFSGWYYETTRVSTGVYQYAHDITVRATWDYVTYDIQYILNGGNNVISNPTTYTCKDKIVLSSPSRVGYSFVGWTYQNQTTPIKNVVINEGTTGSLSYIAHWQANTYTTKFNANGGISSIDSMQIEYDSNYDLPTATRDGYTFGGWFKNASLTEAFDGTYTPSDNYTVYAWWKEETKASAFTYSGIDKISIDLYIGEENVVTIPEYIGGKPVLAVAESAFRDNTTVTSVYIPNTVTAIGKRAFQYCTNLQSISLPDNITVISEGLFFGCSNLTDCNIPSKVTHIELAAFNRCTKLRELSIPSEIISVGELVFDGCTSLKYTVFENVKYLGNHENPYVFLCGYVDGAIITCNVPDETRVIDSEAFYQCDTLTSIVVGPNVTFIGDHTFAQCNSLETVVIGNGVIEIEAWAFVDCYSLKSVVIGDNVTTIGFNAFTGCYDLTEFTLGKNVTYIEERAFDGCSNLTSIRYLGTVADWEAIEKHSLWMGSSSISSVVCSDGTVNL